MTTPWLSITAPAAGSSAAWRRRSSFLIRSISTFMLYGLVT